MGQTPDNQLANIQQEANFLRFLKDNFTDNPKKLQQLVRNAAVNQPLSVQQGIIHSVLKSKNPVGYVRECFKQAFDYPLIIEEFINQGNHGMIVVGKDVYPAKIEARPNWLKVNDRWALSDESDIQHELVKAWMIEHKTNSFKGKIALFPFFGFSGQFRRINKTRVLGKFV